MEHVYLIITYTVNRSNEPSTDQQNRMRKLMGKKIKSTNNNKLFNVHAHGVDAIAAAHKCDLVATAVRSFDQSDTHTHTIRFIKSSNVFLSNKITGQFFFCCCNFMRTIDNKIQLDEQHNVRSRSHFRTVFPFYVRYRRRRTRYCA